MNDVQVLGRVGVRGGQVSGRVGCVLARFGFVVAIGLLAGGLSSCRRNAVEQVPPAGDSADSGISANSELASAESGDEQDSETPADSVLRSTVRDDAGVGQVPDGLQFRLDDLENQIAAANRRVDDELTRGGRAVERFGVLVTVISAVISILLFGLSFVSYLSAGNKAKTEARQWFDDHSEELRKKIEDVMLIAHEAKEKISKKVQDVEVLAEEELKKFGLPPSQKEEQRSVPPSPDPNDMKAFQVRADGLASRQREEYRFEDWNIQALVAFHGKKNYEKAAEFWEMAAKSPDANDDQVAGALVCRGIAQGRQSDEKAATDSFNEVINRFGNSSEWNVQFWVSTARIQKK